ncbi:uncharacterized protein LOC143862272 isoform X2 [Tasmannia lanceolata]|uniref:uncharacterized protein LOC143862272 isoform X2 n=1 Tax=Tasmannia lanceolata TaxID=3420 RepID=UPI004063B2A5
MAPFGLSVPRVSAEVKKKMEKKSQIREKNDKNEGLFSFPLRVYRVSSMSKQQRLEMANQLKSELQQGNSGVQMPLLRVLIHHLVCWRSYARLVKNPIELTHFLLQQLLRSALRSDLTNDNYYGDAFMHRLSPRIHNHVSSPHSHSVDAIIKAKKATPKHNIRWDMEKQSCKLGEFEQPQREEMAQLLEKAKLAEAKNEQKLLNAESLIERKLDRNATSLALTEIQKTISMSSTIEMKPKREFEREAARLALQKMEDTVSLYDDDQFLKDLEMLGIVQYTPTPSSLASEMNCFISHNDLGLFKPSERNPLEQLGLYMKIEDNDCYEDEREEGEIYYDDDREEGEIY